MDVLLFNAQWMTVNVLLAFLGVVFGLLFLKFRNIFLKALFFVLWVLFVPNTVYLATDLIHLPEQFFKLDIWGQVVLLAQYLIILIVGVITFLLGLYPLEKIKSKIRISKLILLVAANYLIAFGVALGRLQGINSWDMVINPFKVVISSFNILTSSSSLIFIFLFGTFASILYFLLRRFLKAGKY